jgi:hypothetical protein
MSELEGMYINSQGELCITEENGIVYNIVGIGCCPIGAYMILKQI